MALRADAGFDPPPETEFDFEVAGSGAMRIVARAEPEPAELGIHVAAMIALGFEKYHSR